jgi:hypothetical protein
MSQVFWSFLYFFVFALWIAGAVGAIVHLATSGRAPVWVIVLVSLGLLLVPVLSVVIYWLVVAARRIGARGPSAGPSQPADGRGDAWPPPILNAPAPAD